MRTLRLFKERGISLLTIGGLYEEILQSKFDLFCLCVQYQKINRRITFV